MRLLKNIISLALPEAVFLPSTCNEGNSDSEIGEMGYRLSQEALRR